MDIAFGSESGAVRGRGEETYLFETLTPGVTLLAVADGFGALAPGSGAAQALQHVRDYLRRTVRAGAFASSMLNTTILQQTIVAALSHANNLIFSRSGSNDDFIAGGIAVVAALIVGRHVFVAHVGDARMYLGRHGRVEMVTFDDAVALEEVPSGATQLPMALSQPRNVLWRSLGTQARLEAGVSQIELFADDRLLFCTSGVHRRLQIDALSAALLPATNAAEALSGLWLAQQQQGADGGAAIIAFDPAEPAAYRAQVVSSKRRARPTLIALLVLGLGFGALLMLKAVHTGP